MIYLYKRTNANGKVETHVTRDINHALIYDPTPQSAVYKVVEGFIAAFALAMILLVVFGQEFIVKHIDSFTGWLLATVAMWLAVWASWRFTRGE